MDVAHTAQVREGRGSSVLSECACGVGGRGVELNHEVREASWCPRFCTVWGSLSSFS